MVKSEKVIKLKKGNFDIYLFSSIISAIVDITIFAVFSTVIFKQQTPINTLVSTIIARVTSSIVNFTINWKLVFKRGNKKSIIRYYILWALQLSASYGVAFLFGNVLGGNLVVVKAIGDVLLGVISYQVQFHWVFKDSSSLYFYGCLATFSRTILRLFTKRYQVLVNFRNNEGVVYVCRHLNMHGPLTTLKWFPFDLHPLVLNTFFDKTSAYNHFKDYTFSKKKGGRIKKRSVVAWVSGFFTSHLVKSVKAVPVYRGQQNPLPTFKKAMEYLSKNQNVIVYPDIEYDKGYETVSDIYDGFLYLSRAYKTKTGKHLKFIPLFIDDENKVIIERGYITIEDIKTDLIKTKEYLIKEINKKSA